MFLGRRRLVLTSFLVASALTLACGDDRRGSKSNRRKAPLKRRVPPAPMVRARRARRRRGAAHIETEVEERDYRLALNNSLDSRERAQMAAMQAATQKAAAHTEAERALGTASATIAEARARLKTAQTSGAPAQRLAAARRNIDAGEQAVQKARAAFNQGSFRDVAQVLKEPIARLAAISRDLEAAPRLATRRGRGSGNP